MLTHERRKIILEYISEHGSAGVTALSRLGRINKVHGGATAVAEEFLNREDVINVKVSKNYEEKSRIARYAAELINDDDYVFIDAGSTTFLLAGFIENRRASFVTNGVEQAKALAANGCKVTLLGGELKASTEAIIGSQTATDLQRYNFSKAFIGANGVTLKQGYTTTDVSEAVIKAIAIERSFVSYVLADSGKFGKVSAVTVAPLETSCIICDSCPDAEIKKKTVVKEVDIS